MCGISAIFGCDDEATSSEMVNLIAHRGDAGYISHVSVPGKCTLSFTRLPIVELNGNGQPMGNVAEKELASTGSIIACTNGEIWNHESIRDSRPTIWGTSDVRVVPFLYEEYGLDFVKQLEGFFAIVLYDKVNDRVVACVDQIGIKPLFYCQIGSKIYFSSEAKSFTAVPGLLAKAEVKKIPPGGILHGKVGDSAPLNLQFYWNLAQIPQSPVIPQAETFRSILMGAVQKRLMADPEVVVGVFLSGGIDSSIVAAMAHRFNKNIIAFTVGVTGSSDLVYAKMVADHLKIKHVIIPFNYEDIIEEAKKSVWHTETYLALTVLETAMMMLVSKVARQHNVKILLSGAGADELLAGYHGAFDDRTRKEKLAASVMFTYNLHVTEARMLDAATMAYTVEGREPFLDPMLIDYCLRLPASALSGPIPEEYGGGKTNKYILRQAGAIDNLLPPQVVWRKKVALYDGGGMNNYVGHFKQLVSPTEFEELKEAYPNVGLKTRADAFMFKIFRERFGEDMCRQNRVSPLFGQYPGGTFEEDGGVGENMDSNGKLKVNQLVAESRVNDIPEQLHKFVSSLVPQFKIA